MVAVEGRELQLGTEVNWQLGKEKVVMAVTSRKAGGLISIWK